MGRTDRRSVPRFDDSGVGRILLSGRRTGVSAPLLFLADEFLQGMAGAWHHAFVAAGGHDDFADVNVAARVDAKIVRGEEIADGAGLIAAAPAGLQFAFTRE